MTEVGWKPFRSIGSIGILEWKTLTIAFSGAAVVVEGLDVGVGGVEVETSSPVEVDADVEDVDVSSAVETSIPAEVDADVEDADVSSPTILFFVVTVLTVVVVVEETVSDAKSSSR